MRPFDDDFTLEDMDRQLEEAAMPSSTLPVEQLNNNRRLLQDVQRFYQHDEEDTRSLNRVLNRLLERSPEGISANEGLPVQQEGRDLIHPVNPTPKRKNEHRTLALIVATLFVSLLVGSMVTLLPMARQGQIAHIDNTTTGGTQQATPTPIPPENIYTTDFYTLYKLDGKTHEVLWKYRIDANTTNGASFLGGSVVSAGSAYITASNGDIHALDSSTGKLRWTAKEGIFTGLVIADGLIFLKRMESPPNGPYTLFALNASDGGKHRTYTLKDSKPGSEPFIAVANKVLYVGVDNQLFALNTQDGSEIWRTSIAEDEHIFSVTPGEGILHVNTTQTSEPIVGVSVIHGDIKGYFEYGFMTDKPQQKWRHKLEVPAGVRVTAPLLADGIQYYNYEGRIVAWNPAAGRVLWDFEKSGSFCNAMHVADGIIYVGEFAAAEKLFALNASNGTILWEKEVNGTLAYVRTTNEKVYTIVNSFQTTGTLNEISTKDGSTLRSREINTPGGSGVTLTIAP